MRETDTYYIYNKHYKQVMVPFVNNNWKTGLTRSWGNKCRWSVQKKNDPWFQLVNNSQFAKDSYKAHSDGTEMTQNSNTASSGYLHGQSTVDIRCIWPEDTQGWALLRQSHRDNNLGTASDDGWIRIRLDASPDGKDQDAGEFFQIMTIYGDSPYRAGSPSEGGLPQ
eukprot:Selendium_serpulae@DN6511_c3_g2_i2.p1